MQNPDREKPKRILLLLTTRTYRAEAFIRAADHLGIEVIKAIDMPIELARQWNYPLGLEYSQPDLATQIIAEYTKSNPIGAILPVDDSGTLVAAKASQLLGLPFNSPQAAEAANNKYIMRRLLHRHNVQIPQATLFYFKGNDFQRDIQRTAESISYPCVIKPINLNGSRGVIRANDSQEFVSAAQRLFRILAPISPDPENIPFLVEEYVPGIELALEGLLDDGQLHVIALFNKPDPLVGPFFEETIYVTPSRLSSENQASVRKLVEDAAAALGLEQGSVHAEIRLNEAGPWIIELAGRSIGGLCSQTLRFAAGEHLESLILRQALGLEFRSFINQFDSSGVMMIPIPQAGLLKEVRGCLEAASLPYIEDIQITVRENNWVRPLPEGDSYLGFIFARGPSPELVESALREAFKQITIDVAPELPIFQ